MSTVARLPQQRDGRVLALPLRAADDLCGAEHPDEPGIRCEKLSGHAGGRFGSWEGSRHRRGPLTWAARP